MEKLKLSDSEQGSGNDAPNGHESENQTTHDIDVFRFLLPGLCHLTAEDKARTILKKIDIHVLLGEYFSYLWKQYQSEGKKSESWVNYYFVYI